MWKEIMSRNILFFLFNIYQVYRNTLSKNEMNFVLMRLRKQAEPCMKRKYMFLNRRKVTQIINYDICLPLDQC
jgi:hypothetical protein